MCQSDLERPIDAIINPLKATYESARFVMDVDRQLVA